MRFQVGPGWTGVSRGGNAFCLERLSPGGAAGGMGALYPGTPQEESHSG